jgi:hypothetical protein
VKGQITIDFVLFTSLEEQQKKLTLRQTEITGVIEDSQQSLSLPVFFCSPSVRSLSSIYNHNLVGSASSSFLFQLEISCNITLKELKELVLKQSQLNHLASVELLRVWFKERLLKRESATLRKQFVTSDTTLTLQILSTPEESQKQDDRLLLYASLREPEVRGFASPVEMLLPLVSGGGVVGMDTNKNKKNVEPMAAAPKLSALRKAISRAFGVPLSQLSIAKYLPYNNTWKPLDDVEGEEEEDEEGEKEKEEDRTTNNHNSKNNKKGPAVQKAFNRLHIRDGGM